ncbi:Ser/Thr protein kinase RdoA involved in Cpx stress response, MazF antagonist [Cohnella sp. OV330]|uniref:phosphotransferase enzyme family protein n=1 Tax=Cohnella sp. OV330 TaxID=1855288 RepID=UPI0008EF59AF|nr:phosphotransferase [Cohnella sp. OV330]SFB49752.1 Ser/Thr protein kinase RdoA involved in Cpx stress response, MazF antagonist [Cohnella sp. OV330]
MSEQAQAAAGSTVDAEASATANAAAGTTASGTGAGAAVQAHGMGAELVRPDWAPIVLEEANRLLSRYAANIGEATALVWHSPRPFSSAALAEMSGGDRLFVKRHHHSVRDVEGLNEEHRFIRHLRANGIPVSVILEGRDGATAYAMDEWTYEVHRLAQGTDLYRDAVSWSPFRREAHAFAAGEALARMHVAAEGFDAPARQVRPLVSSFSIFASVEPRAALRVYVGRREALAGYLARRPWARDFEATLLPLYDRLAPHLAALRPLWTHNDWHASNLLWREDERGTEVASILDFGLADRTNAVYDLATAIERGAVDWLALHEGKQEGLVAYADVEALLAGYESIRPLSATEQAALPALLPLVHAEFALSEIDYFAGIVRSAANADMAYDLYWLGHTAWFQGEHGQALLDYLRQRSYRGS